MNRRGFLGAMLKAGVSAMVLPSAATYARKWVTSPGGIRFVEPKLIVPFWMQTQRSSMCVDQGYLAALREFRDATNFSFTGGEDQRRAFVQDFFFG